jgi:hypothetical protein
LWSAHTEGKRLLKIRLEPMIFLTVLWAVRLGGLPKLSIAAASSFLICSIMKMRLRTQPSIVPNLLFSFFSSSLPFPSFLFSRFLYNFLSSALEASLWSSPNGRITGCVRVSVCACMCQIKAFVCIILYHWSGETICLVCLTPHTPLLCPKQPPWSGGSSSKSWLSLYYILGGD